LRIYSTTSHIAKDDTNATKYQRADFIIICSNNIEVENIESIRREVETGIHRNLVRNTRMSGNIGIYHSIGKSAYHFALSLP